MNYIVWDYGYDKVLLNLVNILLLHYYLLTITRTHANTQMHMGTHMHMQAHMCAHTHTCMHAHAHTRKQTHTLTHTHTHTNSLMSRQWRLFRASPYITPPNTYKLLPYTTPDELMALGDSPMVFLAVHTQVSAWYTTVWQAIVMLQLTSIKDIYSLCACITLFSFWATKHYQILTNSTMATTTVYKSHYITDNFQVSYISRVLYFMGLIFCR